MRYIFEPGARPSVSDNLFLTSAAAYKNTLQMQETPLMDESQKKIVSQRGLEFEPACYQKSSCLSTCLLGRSHFSFKFLRIQALRGFAAVQ